MNRLKRRGIIMVMLLLASGLTSCGAEVSSPTGLEKEVRAIYELYKEENGTLTYEQWLASIKGTPGADGTVVTINAEGYWCLNGISTGVKAKGETGPQGPKGDTGANGKDGVDGAKGETGEKGETGAKGDTGAQGPKGDTGANGKDGVDGVKGETGEKGETGAKGDTGAQGPKGDTGANGKDGVDGAKGETGEKGETGAKGDTAYSCTILPSNNGYVYPSVGSAVIGEEISFIIKPNLGAELEKFYLDDTEISLKDAQMFPVLGTRDRVYKTTMKKNGFVVRTIFKSNIKDTYTLVSNEAELISAIENGGDIKLTKDINLTQKIIINKSVSVFGDGHKITARIPAVNRGIVFSVSKDIAKYSVVEFYAVDIDAYFSGNNGDRLYMFEVGTFLNGANEETTGTNGVNNCTFNFVDTNFNNINESGKVSTLIDVMRVNANDSTFNIVNSNWVTDPNNSNSSALYFNEGKRDSFNIYNSNFDCIKGYTLFVNIITTDSTFNIEDSKLAGWSAMYLKGYRNIVNVKRSELDGTNPYSSSTNHFATITIQNTNSLSLTIANSTITAKRLGNQEELLVAAYSNYSNKDVNVDIQNCKLFSYHDDMVSSYYVSNTIGSIAIDNLTTWEHLE